MLVSAAAHALHCFVFACVPADSGHGSSAALEAMHRCPDGAFLLKLASGCKALAKKAWSLMRAFASQGCPRAI